MRAMAASRSLPTGHAVDGGDHVAAADAGGGGGRIAEGPHHAQRAVRGRHFDADAGVGAGRAHAQVGVFLGVEIGGVRIEAVHQAAQRVVDERGVLDVVDVFALDALHDFGELCGFGRRQGGFRGGLRRVWCAGRGRLRRDGRTPLPPRAMRTPSTMPMANSFMGQILRQFCPGCMGGT